MLCNKANNVKSVARPGVLIPQKYFKICVLCDIKDMLCYLGGKYKHLIESKFCFYDIYIIYRILVRHGWIISEF